MDAEVERQFFSLPASETAWRGAWNTTLDWLCPRHCASCGLPILDCRNAALCRGCALRVNWIGEDRCLRCGDGVGKGSGPVELCPSCRTQPLAFVRSSAAVVRYLDDGPVQNVVLAMKFGGKLHLTRFLGELIAARIGQTKLLAGAERTTIVVGVPMVREALARRGFNQAREMASSVAARLKLQAVPGLLRKTRATRPQATLRREQRRENLKDAFACSPRLALKFKACRVLLIDDVITTGATVSECARALHAAGIPEVVAASFARS